MQSKHPVVEIFKQLVKPDTWVCNHCADLIPANKCCPKCGRNRVILIAQSDATKLVEIIDSLYTELDRIYNEPNNK